MNKILAIDDNTDNLIVLKALLSDAFPDISVHTATSGPAGIATCRKEHPDVVLLDIIMPGMDGYEVCTRLKSEEALKHIPVIMLTATSVTGPSRIRALECGADAFLAKPVDEAELTAQVRAMIRIKEAVDHKLNEKERLEKLVEERTRALEKELTERKRAEQIQKVLFNISNAVATTKDVEELTAIIQQQLGTLLDTTNFYLAFYDEKTGMLSAPFNKDEQDEISEWPADKSLTGYVIRKGKPVLATRDEIIAMNQSGVIDLVGTTAACWLGVPLHSEGRVTGAFVVQSYANSKAYSKKDVEMLEFISDQISLAIQRKTAENELRLALEQAQESDRLKSAFLANTSHEIRTPMNGILGFSTLLEDNSLNQEERKNFISIINRSGHQLLTVINDIIDISKIDINQLTLSKTSFSLTLLLNSLLASFEKEKVRMKKPEILLELIPCQEAPDLYLESDEVRLTQILNNLIGNALKFTSEGFIRFGYRMEHGNLLFFVRDTGKGIAPENHQMIFERFRQEEESHVRTYGGSGLGLSISKGLVELLGGRIWLESQHGTGTTFFFTLPGCIIGQPETPGTNPVKKITPLDFSDKTILVAEDIQENFELMQLMLARTRSKLIHAENGLISVELCKSNPSIDLVLMDIRMPVMDGYEATRKIREFNASLPVIALTAHAFAEDKAKCMAAGCNDFISKPIDREKLIQSLSSYFC